MSKKQVLQDLDNTVQWCSFTSPTVINITFYSGYDSKSPLLLTMTLKNYKNIQIYTNTLDGAT